MDIYSTNPFPVLCTKLSTTLLPGIVFIFIPKESVNHGGRSCKKSRISSCLWLTQYCVSTPSYCCPELFNSLTRVLFFFHSPLYCAVLKSTNTTHFNKPFKSLCESDIHHLLSHQHLCLLKDVTLTSAFLIKWLANTGFRLETLGLTEKVTLLFSSKTN